ncbi:hypothetical protein FRX31_026036 [Thalictrum thalictroides]|uniref:Uncharacterized protein n=1 Tax=Thalictrum thalictroides TaxID=46969 RepID=A0A7J6VIH6_THATH|nr:hypothetical protein FRX31_026036 [Thalictrum thalictroides]
MCPQHFEEFESFHSGVGDLAMLVANATNVVNVPLSSLFSLLKLVMQLGLPLMNGLLRLGEGTSSRHMHSLGMYGRADGGVDNVDIGEEADVVNGAEADEEAEIQEDLVEPAVVMDDPSPISSDSESKHGREAKRPKV